MVEVTLPDGKRLALPDGASGRDLAEAIGPGLAKAALAVVVEREEGEEVRDLSAPLPDGARVRVLTPADGDQALALIRHDAAHVLATAIVELYPGTKLSIGPPIADGFYYDFEFPPGVSVSEQDFPQIEARMAEHIKAAEPFLRQELPIAEARRYFAERGQTYKVELIEEIAKRSGNGTATVSLYTNGPFTDLCRGPHAPDTSRIKAFKLQSVAGAYWRGDARNRMLTRIYGTAFFSRKDLEEHLARLELAKARDHRRLGRELGLFFFSELSPGSPFWTPKGMVVFNALADLWRRENRRRGYQEVRTPILYDVALWQQSGHWDKYRDNMYFTEVEGRTMGLKPMNCPAHIQIYRNSRRSYRELPLRLAEMGLVHRHEASGVLHGLLRVRHITQDDAHIFCAEEQVEAEVRAVLAFAFDLYRPFGFEVAVELSTRPPQRIGDEDLWDRAEQALSGALEAEGLSFKVNPGDGAFYGPKIDLHMTDSLGRSWQLGTVQLDYAMPERFDLRYAGADNRDHRPVLIHRALFGSFERFIGILLEHYGGELPLPLAPIQVVVVPVAEAFLPYAEEVAAQLRASGLRVEVSGGEGSLARKVREAELAKPRYIAVVGEREQREGTVSLRHRPVGGGKREERSVAVEELVEELGAELAQFLGSNQRQAGGILETP
jgi:threonyl-tRNA synthetase